MTESKDETFWKDMMKRLWIFFVVIAIAAVAFIIGLLIILFFQINTSWVGNYGTATIGDFSVGTALLWLIQLILWELLLVFLPGVVFFGIAFYLWWKKLLTPEEKEYIKNKEKKEKSKIRKRGGGAGGGFSFITWIAFFIIVAIDGNWLTHFNSIEYSYWIFAWLRGLMWILIIIGIPAAIVGLLVWIFYLRKKE